MTNTPKTKQAGVLNNNLENKVEETCPWYIKSEKHQNCLWLYILDMSGPDGSMPELVQSQIAQLLGWSNTKTHFMLKQAMQELIVALHARQANQLLGKDHDQVIDISKFDLEPVSSYAVDDTED